jgi:hypothetical protein
MHSIIHIPDSEIVKRAERSGISLGNSAGEIGKSVKGLKMVEEERILTILEKKYGGRSGDSCIVKSIHPL